MNETIQLYTDKNKTIKAYPKTLASQVYMSDGKTTITEQLEDIEQQKANESDVRKNDVLISEIDIAPSLKQMIVGTTPISVIPSPESVRPEMTSFIEKGINLFNKSVATQGKYVQSFNGQIADNASYYASDFIYVKELETYTRNLSDVPHYAFYDKQYNYITGITNVNDKTLTVPQNAYFIRLSIRISDIDTYMFIKGSVVPSQYVAYSTKLNSKYLGKIPASEIVGVLGKDTIGIIKRGRNLFDKLNTVQNKYIDFSSGRVLDNTLYVASDFIKIDDSSITRSHCYQLAWYDSNKNYISGENSQNKTIQKPINAVYVRVSVLKTVVDSFMFELGSIQNEYEEYRWELIDDIYVKPTKEIFDICLPANIYVLQGRTIELYFDQILLCKNKNDYYFDIQCKNADGDVLGKMYDNKFSIPTTSSTKSGNYTLSINVYKNFIKVASVNSNVQVVSKKSDSVTQPYKILPFGDSLINKPWLRETRNIINTLHSRELLQFVGTIPYSINLEATTNERPYLVNEGRPGWTQSYYLSEGAKFTQLLFKVRNITIIPTPKKVYYVPFNNNPRAMQYEFEEAYDINNNVTNIASQVAYMKFNQTLNSWDKPDGQATGGIMTGVNDSIIGDVSINYDSYTTTESNPFWNPTTKAVDFNYYFTKNNISVPNAFCMLLGMNNIVDTKSIIDIVNAIQTQMPNKKVFVMLPHYKGDFYYNIDVKQKFFNFAKTIIEATKNNQNCIIVPLYACHDSKYNMGWVEEPINPRNNNYTIKVASDLVHPQECGYFQFADILCGALISNL